jgi:ligand-binding sensor domain-containing protein
MAMPFAGKMLSALVCLAAMASAQSYTFREYGPPDGLEIGNVETLLQDRTGFLWIGTQGGLYRYDGRNFLHHTTEHGLPSVFVNALHESPDGTLWVVSNQGVAYRKDGRFLPLPLDISPMGLPFSRYPMASLPDGRLLVETPSGLSIITREKQGWKVARTLRAPAELLGEADARTAGGHTLHAAGETLWIGCGLSLCRLEGPPGQERIVQAQAPGLPAERWSVILSNPAGWLFVRSESRLFARAPGATAFEDWTFGPELQSLRRIAMAFDPEGNLVITTQNGIAIRRSGVWHSIGKDNGLVGTVPSSLLTDREGNLWIGTGGHGLLRWIGYGEWTAWTRRDGLTDDYVWSILRDRTGRIWVGTENGVYSGEERGDEIRFRSAKGLPPLGTVYAMATSADGAIWIGTNRGQLLRYDPERASASAITPKSGVSMQMVRRMFVDRANRLWVAGTTGLFRSTASIVGDSQPSFERIATEDPQESFFDGFEDSKGRVWLAGALGLLVIEGGRRERITKAQGLRMNMVSLVREQADGTYWVGYREHAPLSVVRMVDGRWRAMPAPAGETQAPSNTLSMTLGPLGSMWFGSLSGIHEYNGSRWRR